jgi:hypothetical protein
MVGWQKFTTNVKVASNIGYVSMVLHKKLFTKATQSKSLKEAKKWYGLRGTFDDIMSSKHE